MAIAVNLDRQSSLLGLIAIKLGASTKEVEDIMHSQDPRGILEKMQDFESK